MKKFIALSFLAGTFLLLTACTPQEIKEDTVQWDTKTMEQWNQNNESSSTTLSSDTTTMKSCKIIIKEYLADTNTKGDGNTVKTGDTIIVYYIGRLDNEDVFDTNIEHIAKSCGKHNPGRNYEEGLKFTVGAGQMIPGFDKAVQGMKIGQTQTITISPEEGYGEWTEERTLKIPRNQLPAEPQPKIGMQVMAQNGQPLTIYKITEEEITLDANHELAGKTLIFDITIQEIITK